MDETIEKARDAAIRSLAGDLGIDRDEAERWCTAWERFARRQGVARTPYFWDAGRGWIDAHRTLTRIAPPAERPLIAAVKNSRDVGRLGVALLVSAFAQAVGNSGF
jgi:hypothetical protein